jgi:hypothetical protein
MLMMRRTSPRGVQVTTTCLASSHLNVKNRCSP